VGAFEQITLDPEITSAAITSWLWCSFGLGVFISYWFHNYLLAQGVQSTLFSPSGAGFIVSELRYHEWRREQGIPHTKEYKIRCAILLNFFVAFAVYSWSDYLFGT
jgi:hypothetical protein